MMRKTVAAFIVALCALGGALAGSQSTGTLKGKIENDKGKPIAGVLVRVMRSRDRSIKEITTGDAGTYTLELEPDNYVVSFDAEGFQGGTLREMQQVEEGKVTEIKTIRLIKAKRTSLVRGAVFDADGFSLGGVKIKLVRVPTADEVKDRKKIDSFSRDYVTNSRGEFAFRLPSMRARYQLTATVSGFKPETKFVDVTEDESVPLSFSLEPLKK